MGSALLPTGHALRLVVGANESPNVVKGQRSFGKRSHRGSDGPGVPESLSDLKLDWASYLAKTLSELDGVIQQHFIVANIDKQRR